MPEEREIGRIPTKDNAYKPVGANWLLVIGIDQYKNHKNLENAVADAKGFGDVMTTRYGFKHLIEPLYNTDATQANIRKVIGNCEKLDKNDRLIVFYAGHGWYKTKAKLGYIVPTEAGSDPNSDFVPVNFITDIFRAVDAQHILLIVDCCFGGSFGVERNSLDVEMTEKVVSELDTKRSRMVLSSGGIEPVSDGFVSDNNSPFTAPLLDILKLNKEPLTVFSDVFPLLRKKTKWNTDQMPQYKVLQHLGHADGELALYCTDVESTKEQVDNKEEQLIRNLALKRKIEEDFEGWLKFSPEKRQRNSGMMLRNSESNQYPNSNEPDEFGQYSWFKVEIKRLYHQGLEFIYGLDEIAVNKKGLWDFTKNLTKNISEEAIFMKLKVEKIGQINFSDIVDYDFNGDEHYNFPHFYCKFKYKGLPFENTYCVDMKKPYNSFDSKNKITK
jgi:hypothetical protein